MKPDAEAVRKRARAEARAAWIVEVKRLETSEDDLSASSTPKARLAMMWPLALEAYGLAKAPLPTYERRRLPVSVFMR